MELKSQPNRREFLWASGAGALALGGVGRGEGVAASAAPGRKFPGLAGVGPKYTFAIIADPQLGHADDTNRVPANARRTLIQAVEEINALAVAPAFVLFLGDLVNKFDERSVANFEECIRDLKAPRVIVHGNHDTQPPYTEFRALMQRHCGFDDVFYSFDAGPWHYVVLPCNLEGNTEAQRVVEADMLAWLEGDLAANASRPTMIFEHLHTLPIGLAQTEWYTFPLPLRQKLMDLYLRHGNVRWYFNGHVHNGFEASVKTSWQYRGVNFVNCPTIIEMRNFGEEVAGFEKGIDEAGYYVLVSVDGEQVSLEGHRAGQAETFAYPSAFRPFEEKIEPRWWRPLVAWEAQAALVNPAFSEGLAGWHATYRYPGDSAPGSEIVLKDGGVGITTRSKVSHFWANDEYTEIYQLIQLPGGRALLEAEYTVAPGLRSGGGYVRVAGLGRDGLKCHFLWHWGEQENKADYFPRCIAYMVDGVKAGWNYLSELAAQQLGLAWKLPATESRHALCADLGQLFDDANGRPGAFAALGIDRLLVAAGTWSNKDEGAFAAVEFYRVECHAGGAPADGSTHRCVGNTTPLATDASVFQIAFAADLAAKAQKRQARQAAG